MSIMAKKKFRRDPDYKKKRNVIVVGIIMVGLMIFSIVGFAFQGSLNLGGSFNYNGFEFSIQRSPTSTLYFTELDGVEVGFYNDPFLIEALDIPSEFRSELLSVSSISVTSLPLSEINIEGIDLRLVNLIVRDVGVFTNVLTERAYTMSDPFELTPVRDCNSASPDRLVLNLNFGDTNETGLMTRVSDYCYDVNGVNFDFILLRDYMIYVLRGIIV